MVIACALDDLVRLRELSEEIPEQLWSWWSYELGLYQRAATRCRPEMLEILPVIQGVAYPSQAVIAEIKRTISGSKQVVFTSFRLCLAAVHSRLASILLAKRGVNRRLASFLRCRSS